MATTDSLKGTMNSFVGGLAGVSVPDLIRHPHPGNMTYLSCLYLMQCGQKTDPYPFCVGMKSDSNPPAEHVIDLKDAGYVGQ